MTEFTGDRILAVLPTQLYKRILGDNTDIHAVNKGTVIITRHMNIITVSYMAVCLE